MHRCSYAYVPIFLQKMHWQMGSVLRSDIKAMLGITLNTAFCVSGKPEPGGAITFLRYTPYSKF
jgi:hypothetical protein